MAADYNNSDYLEFEDLVKFSKNRNIWNDQPSERAKPYFNEWFSKQKELAAEVKKEEITV